VAIAGLSALVEVFQANLTGRAWLDALPIAIILGAAVRTLVPMNSRFRPGITFSSKFVLELAVVLLGATVDPRLALAAGPALLGGIALVVALSIPLSYAAGRLLGLPRPVTMLIACGNSICGNSAIAAVAPVIGAEGRDVAASIAFTAVLGVLAVLLLPLLMPLTGWSAQQYGVFAGLTVYAVPQVLAATAPVSLVSVQIGTLVKLVRVLTLGPVIAILAIIHRPQNARAPSLTQLLPWFILGFLVMAFVRSMGLIPEPALLATQQATNVLSIIAMAGLGLSTDVRLLAHIGGRVLATALASLVMLGAMSWSLIAAGIY
jgi:uncharacterized integral membrane protein (TIGR00698 family)